MDDVILNLTCKSPKQNLPRTTKPIPKLQRHQQIIKFRGNAKNKIQSSSTSEFSSGIEVDEPKKMDTNEKPKSLKKPCKEANSVPVPIKRPCNPDAILTLFKEPVKFISEPLFSDVKWESLSIKIHPHLIGNIVSRMKFEFLTQAQKKSLDPLLSLKDVLIKAQTGSGKTLAYLVPMLHNLMNMQPEINRSSGTFAMIILPTRELATQTFNVFTNIRYACVRIVCGLLQGGKNRKAEKATLRKGLNVIIGTPQRILDHLIHTNNFSLAKMKWLIVDEADRLLEMNFEKDVKQIVDRIKRAKSETFDQTLTTVLLSATLNEGVQNLAGLLLNDPVKCYTNDSQEILKTNSNISLPSGLRHYIIKVPTKQKLSALVSFVLLKCRYNNRGGKVVIFLSTQDCVDFYHDLFQETLCSTDDDFNDPNAAGTLNLYRLHGNMDSKVRNSVFQKFTDCPAGLLLTTDVASRGLDLTDVSWVVQFQITGNIADYIHRVGRTARAGGRGKAILFLSPEEAGYADLLMKQTNLEISELKLEDVYSAGLHHLQNLKQVPFINKSQKISTTEDAISLLSKMFISCLEENENLRDISERAFLSYLRSYASLTGEMREFFQFKSLHLGHVANCFALKEAPKGIASKVTGKRNPKEFRKFCPTEDKNKISNLNKRVNTRLELDEDIKIQKKKFYDREKSLKKVKPNDIAQRNMLAEYI